MRSAAAAKKCYVCEKPLAAKNEIALNRKLNGRKVSRFYCYGCLAEQMEIDVEELLAKIEDFKSEGCALFE